jgi:hypothetical protein
MFHLWGNAGRPAKGAANRRRVRPAIEVLEDRTVPSTFTVTTLSDGGSGSLRDAIDQANAAPDADTIVFDPTIRGGTVFLSSFTNLAASTADVPQPAGPSAFVITSPVTIQGSGETITRTGGINFRLFQVTAAGNLTLRNLTLRNGVAQGGAGGGNGGGAAGLGGAVYNQGTLSIIGCTLTQNQAVGGDGGGGADPGGGGGLGGPGTDVKGGPPNGAADGSPGFGGGGHAANDSGGFGAFGGGGGGGGMVGGFAGFAGGGGAAEGFGAGGNGGPGGFGGTGGIASLMLGNGGGGGSGLGGAVFNQGGAVTLANSTLTANTARGGSSTGGNPNGGQNGGGYGGGIFNLNGSLTLTNVTLAGNTVQTGSGGAANTQNGVELYNASVDVGSATSSQTATVTVANSILAHAGTTTAVFNYLDPASSGSATINFTGPNIVFGVVGNTAGLLAGTAYLPVDPLLGPLADNGGPTPTMALLPGSPAINAGSTAVALAAGLTTDQRGFGRVGAADLGAFEFGTVPLPGPARQIVAALVSKKVGKTRRLFVRVSFADTGEMKAEVLSPLQRPAFRAIAVSVFDSDGDGVADTIRLTARRGRKTVTLVFTV